jgi:hypothetical protein
MKKPTATNAWIKPIIQEMFAYGMSRNEPYTLTTAHRANKIVYPRRTESRVLDASAFRTNQAIMPSDRRSTPLILVSKDFATSVVPARAGGVKKAMTLIKISKIAAMVNITLSFILYLL